MYSCVDKNFKTRRDNRKFLEMRGSKEARIIRILNTVRSMMMQKYNKIDSALRYELKNLDSIDIFDRDDIKWLENNNVHLLQVNTTLDKYLIKVNQLITTHTNDCKHLITEWITWELSLHRCPQTISGLTIYTRIIPHSYSFLTARKPDLVFLSRKRAAVGTVEFL